MNGRKPKLKSDVLTARLDEGGLALFDAQTKDKALKIAWIPRLICMNQSTKTLSYNVICPKIRNDEFWKLNINIKDISQVCTPSPFWLSVIEEFSLLNYHQVDNLETLVRQRIMYNSHVKVQDKMVFIKELYE